MALQGGRAQGGLELGGEPREVGDPGQLLRRRSVDTDQSTQELGPEAKRRPSAKVQASAPRDRGFLGPRRLDQLRGDSGLADPSLSGESGDAALAGSGLTPDLDQGLELRDPTRERVSVTRVGLGRQFGERGAQLALLLLARLEHPLLVEVAEKPAATEIDSAGPIAGGEPPAKLPEIGSHGRREPDSLTRTRE